MNNEEVGKMFNEGAIRGNSLHMSIWNGKNKTYLVDYGWAVLGERDKKTGRVTFYNGWDGYSRTTSNHIRLAGLRQASRVINEQKKLTEVFLMKKRCKLHLKHANDPDRWYDPKQLRIGMKVEREHTNNPRLTRAIAKAHLSEKKNYYTLLDKAGL